MNDGHLLAVVVGKACSFVFYLNLLLHADDEDRGSFQKEIFPFFWIGGVSLVVQVYATDTMIILAGEDEEDCIEVWFLVFYGEFQTSLEVVAEA